MKLFNGDCLEVMRGMADNSVDAIVTDPPAGIGFMGKYWDKNKGGRDQWIAWLSERMAEVLRVLKPGGHALVWSLPRTSHWTGFALEDAGFEVRDCVYHLFGTGFPKSLDVSKAIDAMYGAEREVIGEKKLNERDDRAYLRKANSHFGSTRREGSDEHLITAPTTEDAKKWSGWGTALKPAVEQWWLVRKPLSEKTIIDNILKWRTGGLNIDECRVPTDDRPNERDKRGDRHGYKGSRNSLRADYWSMKSQGRFPANLTHDGSECVVAEFPNSTYRIDKRPHKSQSPAKYCWGSTAHTNTPNYSDNGSSARFFYCAKAIKSDRDEGLDGFTERTRYDGEGRRLVNSKTYINNGKEYEYQTPVGRNHHPTVKSTELMCYLCRLITPPGGIILDPFMGSGSTGKAAVLEEFDFIGIELDAEYFEIAQRRIQHAQQQKESQLI